MQKKQKSQQNPRNIGLELGKIKIKIRKPLLASEDACAQEHEPAASSTWAKPLKQHQQDPS